MNTRRFFAGMFVICFFSLLAQDAMAFYAPHMGRFLSRDPAGQPHLSRIGIEPRATNNSGGRFAERDAPLVKADHPYHDGMNIYQYTGGRPTFYVDPSGLIPGNWPDPYPGFPKPPLPPGVPPGPACDPYKCSDPGLYTICMNAGNGPQSNCIRKCLLDDYDPEKGEYGSGWFGVPIHIHCFVICDLL